MVEYTATFLGSRSSAGMQVNQDCMILLFTFPPPTKLVVEDWHHQQRWRVRCRGRGE